MAPSRIDEVFRAYGALIYAKCRRILQDDALAEDATQDVFLKSFEHLNALPPGKEALLWLHRVAFNHCLTLLRKKGRLSVLPPEDPAFTALSTSPAPDRTFDAQRAVLGLALRLPEKLVVVGFMHHCDGLSHEDIARALDVSTKTVANRLTEFNAQAQRYLERKGHAS